MREYILVFCWLPILTIAVTATATDKEALIDDSPPSATSDFSETRRTKRSRTRVGVKLRTNKNQPRHRIRGSRSTATAAVTPVAADRTEQKVRNLEDPVVQSIPGHSDFLHMETAFHLRGIDGDLDFDVDLDGDLYDLLYPPTKTPTSSAPTSRPTSTPTGGPTNAPTSRPTNGPTIGPTRAPVWPTPPPTSGPTAEPTSLPTRGRTSDPTSRPTSTPTGDPTKNPTSLPTWVLTPEPTWVLTPDPTSGPTSKSAPTNRPTSRPTFGPTSAPTDPPTNGPTLRPTSAPTNGPTSTPTGGPTSAPTPQPTNEPTSGPTRSPTSGPRAGPILLSLAPSQSPSVNTRNRYQRLGRKIKVACAGGSLTRGEWGGNPRVYSYPNQLQGMLGDQDFDVLNFGRSGATAIRYLDTSYVEQVQYQWAIDKKPDIFLLMLGTSDAKYWSSHGYDFQEGLKQIVNSVRYLLGESPPRIILAVPPAVYRDNLGITNNVVRNEIRPRVMEVASRKGVQLVNMYQRMGINPNYYVSDGVHLNQEGYRNVALNWKRAIQCNRNGVCEVGETCAACPWDCFVDCPS